MPDGFNFNLSLLVIGSYVTLILFLCPYRPLCVRTLNNSLIFTDLGIETKLYVLDHEDGYKQFPSVQTCIDAMDLVKVVWNGPFWAAEL